MSMWYNKANLLYGQIILWFIVLRISHKFIPHKYCTVLTYIMYLYYIRSIYDISE